MMDAQIIVIFLCLFTELLAGRENRTLSKGNETSLQHRNYVKLVSLNIIKIFRT